MKEGWMKNDEGWGMNDDFKLFRGFAYKQTNGPLAFATEKPNLLNLFDS